MIEHRIKIQTDPRGKISSGKKGPNGMPMKLDYFDMSDFPELVAVYGEKPKDVLVVLPSDNPSDFIYDSYALYGSNQAKIRSCDGEVCIHRIDEVLGTEKYAAGEIGECVCKALNLPANENEGLRKKACRYRCYFKAYVADKSGRVNMPLPISFETGSMNSGGAIVSAVKNLQFITSLITGGKPKIAFLPLKMSVRMASSQKKANLTFPIWDVFIVGSVGAIKNRLIEAAKRFGDGENLLKAIQEQSEIQRPNLLTETVPTNEYDQRPVVDEPPTDEEESDTPVSDLFLKPPHKE